MLSFSLLYPTLLCLFFLSLITRRASSMSVIRWRDMQRRGCRTIGSFPSVRFAKYRCSPLCLISFLFFSTCVCVSLLSFFLKKRKEKLKFPLLIFFLLFSTYYSFIIGPLTFLSIDIFLFFFRLPASQPPSTSLFFHLGSCAVTILRDDNSISDPTDRPTTWLDGDEGRTTPTRKKK